MMIECWGMLQIFFAFWVTSKDLLTHMYKLPLYKKTEHTPIEDSVYI